MCIKFNVAIITKGKTWSTFKYNFFSMKEASNTVHLAIDYIFHLYAQFGHEEYSGEAVSQMEHMSQAAQLAMQSGADDELILAAFFHDIGHICVTKDKLNDMDGYGIQSHEKQGADFLRSRGFPEKMVRLIENHVNAKRYLTFKNPDYFNCLSEASRITLEHQGGMMNETEAVAFEQDPLFEKSLLLRKWDEQAKEINKPVLDLEIIKSKARALVLRNMND